MSERTETREEYYEALALLRDKAASRGFVFVDIMLAMARMADAMLDRMVLVDGETRGERFDLAGWWETQEQRMKAAQMTADRMRAEINAQRNGAGGGPSPVAPGGRPPLPGDRGEGNAVVLPAGIEMGYGEPPASIQKAATGKVNPLVAFIATLKVGGWVKFDTQKHSKMTVSWALRTVKKNFPAMELEKRQAIDGRCVVIVRKK